MPKIPKSQPFAPPSAARFYGSSAPIRRPFPHALNIGTDICHIPRIDAILSENERTAQRFLKKVLNPAEDLYKGKSIEETLRNWHAQRLSSGEKSTTLSEDGALLAKGLSQFVAGRWAAKEAIIKAHTGARLTMKDITIESVTKEDGSSGAPIAWVDIWEGAKLKEQREVKISVTHDGEYAMAVCLAGGDKA
jgi:holo-[acyl-carrier protein] synthase